MHNRPDCCQNRLYNITIEVFDDDGNSVYESPVLNPCAEGDIPVSPGSKIEFSFTADREEPVVGFRNFIESGLYAPYYFEVNVKNYFISPLKYIRLQKLKKLILSVSDKKMGSL